MEAFGLVGNGRVLARILDNGTLTEMFFPSIGFYRHIIQSQFGFTEAGGDLYWLSDKRLDRRQYYLEDTNVLVTAARRDGLLIEVADFVPMEQAAVVRKVELRNTRPTPISLRFYHVEAASLEENRDNFSNNMTYYDTIHRCLVRFRGHPFDNAVEAHSVLLVAASPTADGFQCGISYAQQGAQRDAYLDAAEGDLHNNDYSAGGDMGATTGLQWNVSLAPGETCTLTVLLCGGTTLDAAVRRLESVREFAAERLLAETVGAWKEWLAPGAAWSEQLPDAALRRLYRRSLLVNKLLQDSTYGSIIAAPCISPDYRYCWLRDGAFISWAFDLAGYHKEAGHYYRWCARTQTADGLWYQNLYTDGRRHWPGIQVDQVGSVLWGIYQHYQRTSDRRFLSEMWPVVRRGAEYILSRLDGETGLVFSEQDLWEETAGFLTYTNASCQAGLRAAALAAAEVGAPTTGEVYQEAAECLLAQMRRRLVRNGAYVGEADPEHRFPLRSDYLVDVSLLGLSVPFGVVDARAPEMARTAAQIEEAFHYPVGGIGRYASDLFMGGNPWALSALWLSLYYLQAGKRAEPQRHLEWCLRYATPHGFLAEQQEKRTGDPVSAMPLAWAHAWLIALCHALVK